MKILHCCLSNFYIDGFGYQENILPRINKEDGHEVLIIASTEIIENGKLSYTAPSRYLTEYGVPLIRLPYSKKLPHFIARKLRIHPHFKRILNEFAPDVILFHGVCGKEIVTVSDYVKNNNNVSFFADSHTAVYNSARNWISKNILHKIIYKRWFRKALPEMKKVLYIGEAEKTYLKEIMGVPDEQMEFFPLGGEVISCLEKKEAKTTVREELSLHEDTLLFVHSGKLNKEKKTIELLRAFSSIRTLNAVLLIIGVISEEIKHNFDDLTQSDDRIIFLGWKSPKDLKRYISAADLYLQPGSPSATMQLALCCGTPCLIRNVPYFDIYIKSGAVLAINEYNELISFFGNADTFDFSYHIERAFGVSKKLLDYNSLAKQYTIY